MEGSLLLTEEAIGAQGHLELWDSAVTAFCRAATADIAVPRPLVFPVEFPEFPVNTERTTGRVKHGLACIAASEGRA